MVHLFIAVFALLIVGSGTVAAQSPSTGTIAGTMRYVGTVPASQRVTLTDGQVILHNDVVAHPKTKGLRDVAVIVDWKGKVPADAKAKPVLVDQSDLQFVPRVVTVQEGRSVRFENSDLYNHAVDARSIHPENTFNVTTPANRSIRAQVQGPEEPDPAGLALHAWMRAYVIVTPHPYHAVTDAEGTFRIEGVPAGTHALLLIHPDTNYRLSRSAKVQAGKTAEMGQEWKKLKKP